MEKKILNLLASGNAGGIERLCLDVARISNMNNYFYFMWGGGLIAEEIKKYTKNVKIREFKYNNIFHEYKYFEDYIKYNHIDIILLQIPSPIYLLFLRLIKSRMRNIKLCIYIHADPNDIFNTRLKKWQIARCKELFDGAITISQYVDRETKKYLRGKDNSVIYNGVDTSRFMNKKMLDDVEVFRIIYVGRIVPEKGLDKLIKGLIKCDFQFDFTIVGDGVQIQELVELVETLGLSKQIHFVGAKSNVEIWLSQADVFVHPVNCNEGFGISLIEAMASGVPCLAYARGAIPEIINDGVNGFIDYDLSGDSFMKNLEKIYRIWKYDIDKYRKISSNAVRRSKDFGIEEYINNLNSFLMNL